jgi:hypothetical protein
VFNQNILHTAAFVDLSQIQLQPVFKPSVNIGNLSNFSKRSLTGDPENQNPVIPANLLQYQPLYMHPSGTLGLEKFRAKDYMIINNFDIDTDADADAKIHFTLTDSKISTVFIDKAEISIQSTTSNLSIVKETDHKGQVNLSLPEGNYNIKIQKDNYKILNFLLSVAKDANVPVDKTLEPTQVVYFTWGAE